MNQNKLKVALQLGSIAITAATMFIGEKRSEINKNELKNEVLRDVLKQINKPSK